MKHLILFITAALFTSCSYLPVYEDIEVSGLKITEHKDFIELTPENGVKSSIGLMFWPGGLVDPHVYQASLGVFASRGYRVIIVKVPANLAITSINKGKYLSDELGGNWVAAGHSLGGTSAAWSISDYPEFFKGLILFASYPAENKGLQNWNRQVLSISASNDGLATPSDIDSTKHLLPASADYVVISGGNHSQFGSYGHQDTDGFATITKEEQWKQMADAMEAIWSKM